MFYKLKNEINIPDVTADFLNKVLSEFNLTQLTARNLMKLSMQLNDLFATKNQFDEYKIKKEDQAKILNRLQTALRLLFVKKNRALHIKNEKKTNRLQ